MQKYLPTNHNNTKVGDGRWSSPWLTRFYFSGLFATGQDMYKDKLYRLNRSRIT